MSNQELILPGGAQSSSSFTVRDLLGVIFRHKRTVVICFAGLLLGTIFAILANPYRASTKFLISHERMDPVVSPQQTNPDAKPPDVTEEDINSEIEILKSGDVARRVVIAAGLDKKKSLSEYILGPKTPEERIAKATDKLAGDLKVEPVNKSHVITVTYTSSDPKMAANVLNALGVAYMQQHKDVFNPPGQAAFFDQEAQRYKTDLATAENEIKKFASGQNGVAPHVERDITLQKLNDFRQALQQTKADLATADERIASLRKQAGTTPERLTTSTWKEDDFQVLQGLKNTLMSLQLKRTEYLMKYQPDYPLVVEVDKEIAQTQASIAEEDSKPVRQETTDRNPTYSWINEEMAKVEAERSGLQAKLTATQATVDQYEAQARDLQVKGITEQDLARDMKNDEDNYLLYLKKKQEALMTEALNNTQMVNVSIAERPVVPTAPYNSPALIAVIGILVATTVSLGVVFTQEYLDPSFRTPSEVATNLTIPLLAAVPYRLNGFHGNGNGNGNGNGHGSNGGSHARSSDESISMNS
jgi:uncharacterized protein involved in exopolysaccharide biosynthesis